MRLKFAFCFSLLKAKLVRVLNMLILLQSEKSKKAGNAPPTTILMDFLKDSYKGGSEILLLEEDMNINSRTASLSVSSSYFIRIPPFTKFHFSSFWSIFYFFDAGSETRRWLSSCIDGFSCQRSWSSGNHSHIQFWSAENRHRLSPSSRTNGKETIFEWGMYCH